MLKPSSTPTSSAFADILPMLDHVPAVPCLDGKPDLVSVLQATHLQPGPLLPLLHHLQRWQTHGPILSHPRVVLFASAYDGTDAPAATRATIDALQAAQHPLKAIAAAVNVDLRIYEMDLDKRITTAEQAAHAMIYGMLGVEEKGDVIVVASLSHGAEDAARKLTITGETPDAILQQVIPQMGADFFAALGAVLAARLAGQPVLLTGDFGQAICDVVTRLAEPAAAHVQMVQANDFTRSLPPVFAALHALQQMQFMLSFLPAKPVKHVQIV